MSLALMWIGARARVTNVSGADSVKKHLGALGVVAGTVLTVYQISYGNMIVGVHDSRLALNEDLARRIQVEPL